MQIIPIFKYLKSLIIHKYYVGIACVKCGLYTRAITHDLCKLHPTEFNAYYKRFGFKIDPSAKLSVGIGTDGFYEPLDDPYMQLAWKHHIHRSSHHWQHHCVARNRKLDGPGHALEVVEMSHDDIREMLCDWWAAHKAYNLCNISEYWKTNNRRMRLGKATRKIISANQSVFQEFLDGKIKKMPDLSRKSLSEMAIFLSEDV
jgi:hypothetical protein